MDIVELQSTDAPRLLPLLHQVHDLHVTHLPTRYRPIARNSEAVGWLADWLARDGVYAFGAIFDDALAGYAVFEIEHKPETVLKHPCTRAMLQHICVDAAYGRQGVARALFEAAKTHLAPMGIRDYGTTYASFNTASAALMASLGFHPTLIYAEYRP
ncbi:GNAT family N-acetyltransferase [Ruegeria sp. 2205SS24-7]|uniref:GNAT family N-acetyltransferase n=1 Tax=Ruegeria discodermiae TaxID=3064389 RepID=UPI0027408866|nr:GNAT family N-acetyltransferase [Ruegeria sp. 2205SS24-7]MDP5217943.1 GNAT family N-acetyltransferase [Ruegeria sp. 2205SS24-7]